VIDPLLEPAALAALRDALSAAGYTGAGVTARLGPAAVQAVGRGDLRGALRATDSRTALDTLIRLFICGRTEPAHLVRAALPLPDAERAGLVERRDGGYRAGVELEPYGDWWIVSDVSAALRPGVPLPPDHVLGVGGASTTLTQATVREPVATALDLGTGCGVQALHLSGHAAAVTATDLSPRALRFAATTAALNGMHWDLRQGDLAAPVRGERFDLVVSNPPFVVGPGAATHTYRDSGRPGDEVCAELVRLAPQLLNPGGTMQFLANWAHVTGEDWADRVAGWLAGTGLSAWVIQREVSDPVAYVNLWLADAASGEEAALREQWLDWFDANKIEAVGLGLVTVRADGRDDPTVRVEELRQAVDQPFGGQIAAWFDRQDWLRDRSRTDLLGARLTAAPGLALRQDAVLADGGDGGDGGGDGRDGGDGDGGGGRDRGWQVERQRLALTTGLRWVEDIDPVALALVGGCDGRVALRDQLDLLAAAHEVDADILAEVAVPLVAHLVERGFLLPADTLPADTLPADTLPADTLPDGALPDGAAGALPDDLDGA
jgi:methylase of polypeptide subunit release factors